MTHHDRPKSRSVLRVTPLLVGILVIAVGCSGSGSDKGTKSASSGTSSGASDTADATSNSSASPSADASSKPVAAQNFQRTSGEGNVVHLRFDVMSLTRRGELLHLVTRVTNNEPPGSDAHSWQILEFWDQGRTDMADRYAFSAVSLVDVGRKKRHLVAVDSSRSCVCTSIGNGDTVVAPGTWVELAATYAAPPAETTKMDVLVPRIGTFRDVPIT